MRMRLLGAIMVGGLTAMSWVSATAEATPQPNEDSGAECGQVTAWGKRESVSAYPITCEEGMAVANKMLATWPADSRFVTFDGWECAGVTAGEITMGSTWDYSCENSDSGAAVRLSPA